MPTSDPATDFQAPLYVQVRRRIVRALDAQEWPAGAQLPTESQLATRFDVSIGTIRRAVDDLVAEQVLSRQPGRGTFVRSHTEQHTFNLFFQFVDASGARVYPGAQLQQVRRQRADAELARRLEVAAKEPLLRIDNLRPLPNGKPAMLDRIWVAQERFPGLEASSFEARAGSIYGYYQAVFGITIVRIVEDLTVVPAPADIAAYLGVDEGAAVLRVARLAYSFGDAPIEYRLRYVHPGTGLAYRNEIGLKTS